MVSNIRIKDKQVDGLEEASLKLNKVLIEKGIQPVSMAAMVHLFIEKGIEDAVNDPVQASSLYYRKLRELLRNTLVVNLLCSNAALRC